jgi:hypothetical protein
MSSPSPTWHSSVITLLALLGLCCTPVTWGSGGALSGGRAQFRQSCGAACAAPIQASTGEFLAPTASRSGAVLVEKAIQAAEAAQGLITFQRFLTEAELNDVEAVFEECVAQAHADVNEDYQRRQGGYKFKNGKFPSDAECDQFVSADEKGNPTNLAQELGILKHAAAFACIHKRLPEKLRSQISIEPRYKGEPKINGTILTNNKRGSLKPDVVVHASRNATDVQCVYEFKFPCHEKHRLDPIRSPDVVAQLNSYRYLSKGCRVTLVTPSGLKPYEGE